MNGFREDEVVLVQGRAFPVVGGRLRLAHEANQHLTIKTEVVQVELEKVAIVRAIVTTEKGEYTGTGVATAGRDGRLVDALLELAETRAVARALRFAGYGMEVCGVEELGGDVPLLQGKETEPGRHLRVVAEPTHDATNRKAGSHPYVSGATSAQRRAIETLARKLGREVGDIVGRAYPGTDIDALTLAQASSLIDQMKTKVGNGGNGARR